MHYSNSFRSNNAKSIVTKKIHKNINNSINSMWKTNLTIGRKFGIFFYFFFIFRNNGYFAESKIFFMQRLKKYLPWYWVWQNPRTQSTNRRLRERRIVTKFTCPLVTRGPLGLYILICLTCIFTTLRLRPSNLTVWILDGKG